jgi:acylphosphatase
MMERRSYRITGQVQGVGFRWWTRKMASDMNLRGTVRNAGDGSVEVRVEGPVERLDGFEDLLRRGPAGARVRGLDRVEPGDESLPTGFDIVR